MEANTNSEPNRKRGREQESMNPETATGKPRNVIKAKRRMDK